MSALTSLQMAAEHCTQLSPGFNEHLEKSILSRDYCSVVGNDPGAPSVSPPAGQAVEKVGEAFKEDGSVGHQFTEKGAAGGWVTAWEQEFKC